MLLCLDCGNSRLKWALRAPEQAQWLAQAALPLAELGQLAQHLHALNSTTAIRRVLGVSVVDHTTRQAIDDALATLGLPIHWQGSQPDQCGVHNGYRTPTQLGADRWAALIGAWTLRPRQASLVVVSGTATTVDVLSADGEFRGGLILPGLTLMQQALAQHTVQLTLASSNFAAYPTDTHSAMASGCLQATAGAIERMYAQLAREDRTTPPGCLLSGGAADLLLPRLDIPVQRIENLVLEGLARMAADPP